MRVAIIVGLAFGFAFGQPSVAEQSVTDQVTPVGATIAIGKGGASADYLSARFSAEHHDLPQAAELFAKCAERDKNNTQLQNSAFFYAVAAGQIERGAVYAKGLVAAQSGQRIANLALAAVAMKHGDFKTARAEIAKSPHADLSTFAVNLVDAWAAAGQGDRAAASAILADLNRQRGIETIVTFNEALLAEYFSDTTRAEALYRKLVASAWTSPRLVEAYGRFLERAGKTEEAKSLYAKAVSDPASRPVATAGLARIAGNIKPEAFVTRPQEGAAEALLGVATAISDEGGADVSIVFLQMAKYLRNDFELADLMVADRFEMVGNYEAAIAIYDRIPVSSPYARVAALQNAADKMQIKREDEALKDLESLSGRYPEDLTVWMTYGDVLRQLKKNDAAVKAYTKAVSLLGEPEKKNWSLYFARANAAQSAGDWKAAESDLKLALKLNPDEPQILNFLGYTWVDQNENLKQGVAMLEKASKLAPNDGYITDSIGWAYYRLGRYREATDKLETAVLQVPQDPTVNDHLGDVYWKIGRKLDAEFQWNHALAFGPTDEDKAKIAKKLQAVPAGE